MKTKKAQRTIPFDTAKTLEQLENSVWDEPAGFMTGLILTCHRLRKVPLEAFTVENLRVMIGQQIGLKFLLPLALETLKATPLAEGSLFEGDLLCSLLRVDPGFWSEFAHWQQDLAPIIVRGKQLIAQRTADETGEDFRPVLEAIEKYEAQ